MEPCGLLLEYFPLRRRQKKLGIRGLIVPTDNGREAAVVPGLTVYAFKHLSEVADFLNNPSNHQPVVLEDNQMAASPKSALDLRDVKGQAQARRALEIAAAGGHNLIFCRATGQW